MLCIVYVSEGIKKDVLRHLTDTAIAGGKLAHSFPDAIYGRTSFFLTGEGSRLADRAVVLCNEAFKLIDYRYTTGTHPALGSGTHFPVKSGTNRARQLPAQILSNPVKSPTQMTSGTHPALDSVDHVCFQPLGSTTLGTYLLSFSPHHSNLRIPIKPNSHLPFLHPLASNLSTPPCYPSGDRFCGSGVLSSIV